MAVACESGTGTGVHDAIAEPVHAPVQPLLQYTIDDGFWKSAGEPAEGRAEDGRQRDPLTDTFPARYYKTRDPFTEPVLPALSALLPVCR